MRERIWFRARIHHRIIRIKLSWLVYFVSFFSFRSPSRFGIAPNHGSLWKDSQHTIESESKSKTKTNGQITTRHDGTFWFSSRYQKITIKWFVGEMRKSALNGISLPLAIVRVQFIGDVIYSEHDNPLLRMCTTTTVQMRKPIARTEERERERRNDLQ